MFRSLSKRVMGLQSSPLEKMERIVKETGNNEKLKALLVANPENFFSDARFEGLSALHWTVKNKFNDCTRTLLESSNIDVNLTAEQAQLTALHFGVLSGDLDAIKVLFEYSKPNIDAMTREGETALLMACAAGRIDIVAYLCSRGANVSVRNSVTNMTGLHIAAELGLLDIVAYLTQSANSPVDEANSLTGCTALHYAAMQSQKSVVVFLINVARADPLKGDKSGLKASAKVGTGSAAARESIDKDAIRDVLIASERLRKIAMDAAAQQVEQARLKQQQLAEEEVRTKAEEELLEQQLKLATERTPSPLAIAELESTPEQQPELVVAPASSVELSIEEQIRLDMEAWAKSSAKSEEPAIVDDSSTVNVNEIALVEDEVTGSDPRSIPRIRPETTIEIASVVIELDSISAPTDNDNGEMAVEDEDYVKVDLAEAIADAEAASALEKAQEVFTDPATSHPPNEGHISDSTPTVAIPSAAVIAEEDFFSSRARRWQEQAKLSSQNIILDMELEKEDVGSEHSSYEVSEQVSDEAVTEMKLDVEVAQSTPKATQSPVRSPSSYSSSPRVASARSTEGVEDLEEKIKRIMSGSDLVVAQSADESHDSDEPAADESAPVDAEELGIYDEQHDIQQDVIGAEDVDEAQEAAFGDFSQSDIDAALASTAATIAVTPGSRLQPVSTLSNTGNRPLNSLDDFTQSPATPTPSTFTAPSTHDHADASSSVKKLHHIYSREDMVGVRRATPGSDANSFLDDFADDSTGNNTPYKPYAASSLQVQVESDIEDNENVIAGDDEFIDPVNEPSNVQVPVIVTPGPSTSSPKGTSATKSTSSPSDGSGSLTKTSSFHQRYLEATRLSTSPAKASPRMSPRAAPAPITAALKVPAKDTSALQQAALAKEQEIAELRASAKWSRAGRKEFASSVSNSTTEISDAAEAPESQEESTTIAEPVAEPESTKKSSSSSSRAFFPEDTSNSDVAVELVADTTSSELVGSTPVKELRNVYSSPMTPNASKATASPAAPNSAILRKRVSGSVKLLSALAKYQGKFNFKALCKGFFRWTELMQERPISSSPQQTLFAPDRSEPFENDEPELNDNAFSYARNYGNGQFAHSLTQLCSFYERFHYSDQRAALLKAFTKLKYNIVNSSEETTVPPAVKQILKQNEHVLWPIFVHYSHNELAIPKVVKGTSAHRRKKMLGQAQIWSLFRDLSLSPDLIGKIQLENLVAEVCNPVVGTPAAARSLSSVSSTSPTRAITPNKEFVSLRSPPQQQSRRPATLQVSSSGFSPQGKRPMTPTSTRRGLLTPMSARGSNSGFFADDDVSPTTPNGSSSRTFNRLEALRSNILGERATVAGHDPSSGISAGVTIDKQLSGQIILSFDGFVKLLWRICLEFVDAPMLGPTSRLVALLRRMDTSDVRKHIIQKSIRSTSIKVPPFALNQFTSATRARYILDASQPDVQNYGDFQAGGYDNDGNDYYEGDY